MHRTLLLAAFVAGLLFVAQLPPSPTISAVTYPCLVGDVVLNISCARAVVDYSQAGNRPVFVAGIILYYFTLSALVLNPRIHGNDVLACGLCMCFCTYVAYTAPTFALQVLLGLCLPAVALGAAVALLVN
jgi:hypothetical protein